MLYSPHLLTFIIFCLGPIPGLTSSRTHSRTGVPVVEMDVKDGVAVEMDQELVPPITGESPKKVQAL